MDVLVTNRARQAHALKNELYGCMEKAQNLNEVPGRVKSGGKAEQSVCTDKTHPAKHAKACNRQNLAAVNN